MTVRVGELRPNQLLHTFGVGAVVDLPHISALVMGLDGWDTAHAQPVPEDRLLAAVQAALGSQVTALRTAPYTAETPNPFEDWTSVGVPVAVFPRWLRCPACRYLGSVDTGLFTLKTDPFRPDRVRYVHSCTTRGKPPEALPARFLLACRAGHLDDFPWVLFCHRGRPCPNPMLELYELGVSGDAASIEVRCRSCDTSRRLAEAFGETARSSLPKCRGRHPQLGSFDSGCSEEVRTILLGASNAWFPVCLSVLSVPASSAPLAQKVAERWTDLEAITSKEVLAYAWTRPELAVFAPYSSEDLWGAIEAHRGVSSVPIDEPLNLLGPEWRAFSDPAAAPMSDEFRLRPVAVPPGFANRLAEVVLAERLREVVALIGFTRVDAPGERDEAGRARRPAPLSRRPPLWVPCGEVRGEGVFLRFPEDALREWERSVARSDQAEMLQGAHRQWRARRGLDPDLGWPGPRYVLLHTLAHALIRQFALECGYGAAGIRERIYADASADEATAGILLYTAAPDSEGTLGGLVSLGEPENLEPLLEQALEHARLCSSDPLCSEHDALGDASLHGAACHACLFAAETSCERANRYLDRSFLVGTFGVSGLGYFAQ